MRDYIDYYARKAAQLSPDDKLRRSLLERLTDLFLSPKRRLRHHVKRCEKATRRIGF